MYGRYTIPCCEQRNLQMAENHCAYFHATGRFSDWCAARGIRDGPESRQKFVAFI
jgi:hypothetical protein